MPFATYVDWGNHTPYSDRGTQIPAYQHALDHYGPYCEWQTAVDMDEYPISEQDIEPGFMVRFLKRQPRDVGEVSMANYLMLGPMNTDERLWLAERYTRLTLKPANQLVKPVYRPRMVFAANLHHNPLARGRQVDAPTRELRLAHVQGARLDKFSSVVSARVKAITKEDALLASVVGRVRNWSPRL